MTSIFKDIVAFGNVLADLNQDLGNTAEAERIRAKNSTIAHGSFYDRGMSDSYYDRPRSPHCWLDSLGRERREASTAEEIAAYHAGYDDNEADGHKKDWGDDRWDGDYSDDGEDE
jgi:hypothetical protein